MTDHVLTTAVLALCEAFGRKASPATFEAYRIGLEAIDDQGLARALAAALRTCHYMPSPAELRELSGELQPAARAIKAWEAFRSAHARCGYRKSVNFDDTLINATIRNLGGWEAVCLRYEAESASETWLRKDFDRIYAAMMAGGITDGQTAPLRGSIERENALLGFTDHIPAPVLIETGLPQYPTALPAQHGPRPLALPSTNELLDPIGRMPE